ncbi:MAG: hypothetical protein SFW09_03860 [Hyphomicrobiaceae bacterium]|nr:hypothetical protein [Hyphomicrobiaceae bacterium]
MSRRRLTTPIPALVLLTNAWLVHAALPGLAQAPPGAPAQTAEAAADRGGLGLPPPAAEMREVILEAARSGRLEELRNAVELNEIKPTLGDAATGDPIDNLRRLANEPDGRDLLAALAAILDARWTVVRRGPDHENNRVFVWPRFAEKDLRILSPADEAELRSLAPPDALERMRASGIYDYWRIGIGADGTWHYLRK